MIHFETDKKPLTYLLDMIEKHLALPDFQRSFVWDPDATRELVVSVIRSFPAGTLLEMEGGGRVFAPRAFEEPDLYGKSSHLILDGQQRLTSLYQAFVGKRLIDSDERGGPRGGTRSGVTHLVHLNCDGSLAASAVSVREFVGERRARLLDIRRSAIEEFRPKITFPEDDVA